MVATVMAIIPQEFGVLPLYIAHGSNQNLPPKSEIMEMEMEKEKARDYARLVMQRFSVETQTFRDLIFWMKLYRNNSLDAMTLSSEVHTLFRGHNDLILGFHKFYPHNHDCACFPRPPPPSNVVVDDHESGGSSSRGTGTKATSGKGSPPRKAERKGHPSWVEDRIKDPSEISSGQKRSESINFLNMVRKKLGNDHKYRKFLEALCRYQAHKDTDRLNGDAFKAFKENPELHVEFSRHLVDIIEARFDKKEDMDMDVVVKETEEKSCQDQEKKKRKQNPYQKDMFVCEDEMYAADMTIHRFESTRKAAIRCLEKREEIERKKYGAEDFYKASDLRLIKHLYSCGWDEDDGRGYEEVVVEQLLHEQPIRTSELILKRLDEKLAILKSWHQQAKVRWAKRIRINHENCEIYKLSGERQASEYNNPIREE